MLWDALGRFAYVLGTRWGRFGKLWDGGALRMPWDTLQILFYNVIKVSLLYHFKNCSHYQAITSSPYNFKSSSR